MGFDLGFVDAIYLAPHVQAAFPIGTADTIVQKSCQPRHVETPAIRFHLVVDIKCSVESSKSHDASDQGAEYHRRWVDLLIDLPFGYPYESALAGLVDGDVGVCEHQRIVQPSHLRYETREVVSVPMSCRSIVIE